MAWTIEYTRSALDQLRKLDRSVSRRIINFMDERVATQEDPCTVGKSLCGVLGTFWRYRVGDYRVICEIQHSAVTVIVIRVGHRREVYR